MLVGNSDNHKQNCEFSEQSVAFLYGELDKPQEAKFNLHLANCSVCADEIHAFSAIHFSIRDWKSAKFDLLATPVIEIPPDLTQPEIAASNSWLANLRARFFFGRGLVPASVFAVLLICVGFGFLFFNNYNHKEIADNNNINKIITDDSATNKNFAATEKPDAVNQAESENPDKNQLAESDVKSTTQNTVLPIKEKVQTKPDNVKNSRQKSTNGRVDKIFQPSKNLQPVNRQSLPKLNNLPEDAEDDELRLADLFAEIGDR